jgi:hypothetical protein
MKSFQIFALLALFMLIVVYNNKTKEGAANKQRRKGPGRLSSGTANMYGGGNINSKRV